jgi:hypothetical protein
MQEEYWYQVPKLVLAFNYEVLFGQWSSGDWVPLLEYTRSEHQLTS